VPVARQLELLDRTTDTAFRPKDANPSPELPPLGPLPPLGRDGDSGVRSGYGGCGGNESSSSSVSSALPYNKISRIPGENCPRLVRMFMARLRGEMGGEYTPASSVRTMMGKQQREG
jgi:hypothetical protein